MELLGFGAPEDFDAAEREIGELLTMHTRLREQLSHAHSLVLALQEKAAGAQQDEAETAAALLRIDARIEVLARASPVQASSRRLRGPCRCRDQAPRHRGASRRRTVTKRGRRGGGTVFYDKSRGRYVGQLSLGFDDEGNRKRGPKVHGETAAECWDQLDGQRAELKEAGRIAPRDLTVAHLVNDLMAHPPARWKSPLTLQQNQLHADRIIAKLGKIKVARLTVTQVERLLEGMAAAGTPPTPCAARGRCCVLPSGALNGTAGFSGTWQNWPRSPLAPAGNRSR